MAREVYRSPTLSVGPGEHLALIGPLIDQFLGSCEVAENKSTVERKPLPRVLDHGSTKYGSAQEALGREQHGLTRDTCGTRDSGLDSRRNGRGTIKH